MRKRHLLIYNYSRAGTFSARRSTLSLLPEYGRPLKLRDYKSWTADDGQGAPVTAWDLALSAVQ